LFIRSFGKPRIASKRRGSWTSREMCAVHCRIFADMGMHGRLMCKRVQDQTQQV